MKNRKIVLFSSIMLLLALSACIPAKTNGVMIDKPTEAMEAKATDEMMPEATEEMVDPSSEMMGDPTESMMEKPTDSHMLDSTANPGGMMDVTPTPDSMTAKSTESAMMEAPVWLSTELINVTTGDSFTINEFKDKVVVVELMAQWCSTCKQQQMKIIELREQLGMPADLITIGLDIDPNENGVTLKTYAADNGFNWIYAISPAAVSREIGNLYGDLYLNPPSAPMLIVDRKGDVHPLPFGIKSADDLKKALEPYLNVM